MITVDVSLDPFGSVEDRETLARIVIWNDDTGDPTTGNYKWAVSHQFDSFFGAKAADKSGLDEPGPHDLLDNGPWVWKRGRVEGFRRQRGAVALLAAVLKAARL